MKESPAVIILALFVVIGLAIGGWYVKRWFNWKYGYEENVAQQVEPLEKRVSELEKRVEKLEHGK
jgi:hypothetical protein